MMILLIFPHQLFEHHPGLRLNPDRVAFIEDSLFFGDERYPLRFHKQKLWLHRATMKRYELALQEQGFETTYLEYESPACDLPQQLSQLCQLKNSKPALFCTTHPTDFILEKRLERSCDQLAAKLEYLPNPGFLNSVDENLEYREKRNRWFMADFYKWQRRRLDILMNQDKPVGEKWSFDADNRKKVPKKMLGTIPPLPEIFRDSLDDSAREHVERLFPHHPGSLDQLYYPTSHQAAREWLEHFLAYRLERFGDYEDAIVQSESWLWHSVLTPSLNIGLLTPAEVVKATLDFAEQQEVPLNSLEGFLRQIIGWREFMRATYQDLGVTMRTTNHWNHRRPIPPCFYDGTTGITPIDDTIQRILKTGYCHHIERLMVLGGFMFLCEFEPDEIYRWFMEMFVDSYDWVMVPNVYAMSQHADGGLITTKPYFSGSAYIRKMSHYPKAAWCATWDGLYWRWIWNHVDELAKNPRWAMMCRMAQKMSSEQRETHLQNADAFLAELDSSK